ncbi:DNA/RNA non-specific endonuclease [Altericista sp. CCNU0014]|uniref:DNA/RNA non-specific endonuclease n=1 Tax=Altericista sp. CCNU0014 TaxID=3082949 RepID=UPI0038511E32
MARKSVSTEMLKNFVRKEAPHFLKQENITSVGIGYKIKDSQRTETLSIQFTVGRKVAPEALESIGAVEIPKSFTIDGVEVPTDVVPRSYDLSAKEVKLEVMPQQRKAALNPIVPGISVGHPKLSAGTVGCVVYDAMNGEPFMLSNWHVLQGAAGKIGDEIVQPGSHDDNRVSRNIVGKLVRSHLGVAGDCAIASIDRRQLDPEIFDLKVDVARIGEPELGDRVVKSGRTTNVTYGIVQRIHVVTRMDYAGVGSKEIGCFEIGPDSANPAPNGEISMGGDSGAAWLSVDEETTTDMMLGLHFAGEIGDEPENALACYAASVFEKLNISPQQPSEIVQEDIAGLGYAETFLGEAIAVPQAATDAVRDDLLEIDGQTVIPYTHFSLAMSRSRRFARWVAWNVDGGALQRISRSGIKFKKDPKLPADAQVGDELYRDNPLDRGHIARRADLLWGTEAEARKANTDSFFFTNITPQHEAFNQSGASGIWGALEDAIFADVDVADLRVAVMGGPIFAESDPTYRGTQLPKQFWKAIYFRETGNSDIQIKGYVLTQADLLNNLEALELPDFSVYEVPIASISQMTGLVLPSGSEAPVRATGRRQRGQAIATVETVKPRRITSVDKIL